MRKSNKMKLLLKVMRSMNIAICCLIAGIGVFEKNALAACGWLAAAVAYIQINDLLRCCEDWNDISKKTVDMLHAIFGTGGQIVGIDVKRVGENKEPEEKRTDFATKASESFNECAKEFFHYIEEGNREFSISHGGVTLSVSIPEDDYAHAEG
jgi:hypothetical protein